MCNIKVLDSTLRDGGYVNNWNFGSDSVKFIVSKLQLANVEYIEVGFLTDGVNSESNTLFSSLEDICAALPEDIDCSKIVVMFKVGKFSLNNFPNASNSKIKNIRLIFKKHEVDFGILAAKKLISMGYRVFVNPTFCANYSNGEFIKLLTQVNEISPFAFSVVDSTGALNEADNMQIFKVCNSALAKNIALCFHFHNNLQLAFSNAKQVLESLGDRKIILDSTIYGIGRGAGNLQTEILAEYLNNNFSKNYNISYLQEILNCTIAPIYKKSPWGFTIPYYLSAKNGCHPYYAKFLSKFANLTYSQINCILQSIPAKYKNIYDEKVIATLFSSAMK